jgi:hypothetical protein
LERTNAAHMHIIHTSIGGVHMFLVSQAGQANASAA